jgi:hypothetical protein
LLLLLFIRSLLSPETFGYTLVLRKMLCPLERICNIGLVDCPFAAGGHFAWVLTICYLSLSFLIPPVCTKLDTLMYKIVPITFHSRAMCLKSRKIVQCFRWLWPQ